MKHTPGPWTSLTDTDRETIVSEHVNAYGNFIVTIVTRGDERMTEEDRANARLIAAAPELLEALEYASELIKTARQYFPKSIRNHHKFNLENTCATIGKAISKARNDL
jgi:hypothetical protein